jgi:hypothetical protein
MRRVRVLLSVGLARIFDFKPATLYIPVLALAALDFYYSIAYHTSLFLLHSTSVY